MKNIFLLISVLFIVNINTLAQVNKDGLPLLVKYTDKDYGESGQVWAITQDRRGIMYFGCNLGVKTFDGKNWKTYNNPNSTIIKSLAVDKSGLVFYGAESDFGVLLPDSLGKLNFYSLFLNYYKKNPEFDFSSVWKTLIAGNRIYFQSFEKVFYTELPLKIDKYNNLLNKINFIKPEKSTFHLSFSVNNQFYIREWEKGLSVVKDDKAILIPGGEQFAFERIYGMLPYDGTKILIITRSMGLFIYDTQKKSDAISKFTTENDLLISESSPYTADMLNDETIALGTFNNGIIILNKSGKIIKHLTEKTGLPQHYIYSIFSNSDKDGGALWFSNDDDGIYRADFTGPFTTWNEYTGLEGPPYFDALRFNNLLYLISGSAVYYLAENDLNKSFVKIGDALQAWDLMEFDVPGSNEKKLLLGTAEGIYEVSEKEIKLVVEMQQAFKLYQSAKDSSLLYVGTTGLNLVRYDKGSWINEGKHDSIHQEVRSIYENKNFLALGSTVGITIIDDFYDKSKIDIDSTKGLPMQGRDYNLTEYNGKVLIVSESGLYTINEKTFEVEPLRDFGNQLTEEHLGIFNFKNFNKEYWMSVYETNADNLNFNLIKFNLNKSVGKDSVFSKILPQKPSYLIYFDGDYTWVGNEKGLFKYNRTIQKNYSESFNTIITKVSTAFDSVLFNGNYIEYNGNIPSVVLEQKPENQPILSYKYNAITFEWASPFFEKSEETVYSYRLSGETEAWSKWDKKNDTRYTNLHEGTYIFEVKAKNIYNIESPIARFSFEVLPPWYRTVWAYISFLIMAVFAIIIIIRLYTKKLKRENEKLEQIVKERTAEIRMQNEEITAQRDEIQEQKEKVEKAKDKIEKQQKHIMDSIHYASRIQEAVLPPDDYLQEILGEHFVLFKPRDIVSGDFYWATQKGNKTVIVAADCTGHGVPGAFMSMLGMSFLNEIVNKEEILEANIILNRLRENVKRSLRQTGKDNEAKDGMDIALCIIDMENMQLQFAGAYNPLLIIRNGNAERIKPDRMPIGIYLREKESFSNNIIEIQKGDFLYIFSDGFVDQFGGKNNQKIRSENLQNILLENNKKSVDEQKKALEEFLQYWMSFKDNTGRVYKQVDDILIIGIEI